MDKHNYTYEISRFTPPDLPIAVYRDGQLIDAVESISRAKRLISDLRNLDNSEE